MRHFATRILFFSLLAAAAAPAYAQPPDPIDEAATKIAVQVCSNCHGPGGLSKNPIFPRLAGQQPLYLEAQIKAFRNKTRGDPEAHDYMWGMATLLDDPMVAALAKYYGSQTPAPGTPGDPALVAAGAALYAKGDAVSGVAACAGCHGADAAGNAIFPRLAGQHAQYIARQIEVIQSQLRTSPIMHGVVSNLSKSQVTAVAAYLEAQ
jgi:cytochrome c553